MAEGGAAVLGLSSAHRYCPKLLLGGAVPVLAAVSGSIATFLALEGLLGMLYVVSVSVLLAVRLSVPAHSHATRIRHALTRV